MKKILRTIIMLLAVLAVPSVAHADGTFTATRDVNDDGSVNISDVTALIDHLLGGTSGSFNVANADVDADSHINIADVTYLIDYLLSGKWPGGGPTPATQTFTVNGVSFPMVTVEGGTFTIEIKFTFAKNLKQADDQIIVNKTIRVTVVMDAEGGGEVFTRPEDQLSYFGYE